LSYYGTRVLGVSGNRLVGEYYPGPRGFSFDGAAWTQLDYPGSASGNNNAVDGNNIVGLADGRGALFDGATWTLLSYPGSVFTNPLGIDGDRIVGFYETDFLLPPLRRGFVYDGAVWSALDYPGGVTTEAHGVDGNNIVGNWWDGSQGHGFLYDGNSWQSFDYPGSIATIANDISGDRIVGLYFDQTGNSHSFVATIPEPASWSLAALALVLAGARRRGKRTL
jgi:MYXO-CTERM domain-containing protein